MGPNGSKWGGKPGTSKHSFSQYRTPHTRSHTRTCDDNAAVCVRKRPRRSTVVKTKGSEFKEPRALVFFVFFPPPPPPTPCELSPVVRREENRERRQQRLGQKKEKEPTTT